MKSIYTAFLFIVSSLLYNSYAVTAGEFLRSYITNYGEYQLTKISFSDGTEISGINVNKNCSIIDNPIIARVFVSGEGELSPNSYVPDSSAYLLYIKVNCLLMTREEETAKIKEIAQKDEVDLEEARERFERGMDVIAHLSKISSGTEIKRSIVGEWIYETRIDIWLSNVNEASIWNAHAQINAQYWLIINTMEYIKNVGDFAI